MHSGSLTLYLRDPVYTPREYHSLPLLTMEQGRGTSAVSFDVVDSPKTEAFIESARASGRLLEAGIYRAPDGNVGEVKVLMSGWVHGHWSLAETLPRLRTIVFRLRGALVDLAGK